MSGIHHEIAATRFPFVQSLSKHERRPRFATFALRHAHGERAFEADAKHFKSRWRILHPLLVCTVLAAMTACTPLQPRNPMATWVRSKNFDLRAPQLIVLHFTNQDSIAQALATLRTSNSGGPVSAHYLIGRDGHIYQLVSDTMRAWHAGGGRWGTITDVNSASIGIELDNDGHVPFPPAQIDSLIRLLTDLTTRWHIPRTQIIGHEDMAPSRKDDPGPLFPWATLAADGFGLWPDPGWSLVDPPPDFDPWLALTAIGYSLDDPHAAVHAFHNHFRGMGGDTLDAEDLHILYNLVGKLERGDTEKWEKIPCDSAALSRTQCAAQTCRSCAHLCRLG